MDRQTAQKALEVFRREQKERTVGPYTGCYCSECIECMEIAIKETVGLLVDQQQAVIKELLTVLKTTPEHIRNEEMRRGIKAFISRIEET